MFQAILISIVFRIVKLILSLVLFLVIALPFGFLGDRPKRVQGDEDESVWAVKGQWASAAFYAGIAPLLLMQSFGLFVIALLPFAVVVVARRYSARFGNRYYIYNLRDDISKVLKERRTRNIALYGSAAALISVVVYLIGLLMPLSEGVDSALLLVAFAAAGFVWGTGIHLARKAADRNNVRSYLSAEARENLAPVLSKATGTPENAWLTKSHFEPQGELMERMVIVSPPAGAAMHYDKIEGFLALSAPEWEMNSAKSNHKVLVLDPVSEETRQRRLEMLESDGLIAGKISEADDPYATAEHVDVVISLEELRSS